VEKVGAIEKLGTIKEVGKVLERVAGWGPLAHGYEGDVKAGNEKESVPGENSGAEGEPASERESTRESREEPGDAPGEGETTRAEKGPAGRE
jgi:hypothetical protein